MPESIPSSLIIDEVKNTFREARAAHAAEVEEPPQHDHLGWVLSVPDTHQKTVLAALDKEPLRMLTPKEIAIAEGVQEPRRRGIGE